MKQLIRFFKCNKSIKISVIFGTNSIKNGTFFAEENFPHNHFYTVYQTITNIKKQIHNFWHETCIYAIFLK